jgi:hypothetical protein
MLAPVAVARGLKIQSFGLAQNWKSPARAYSIVFDGGQKPFERNVLRVAAVGQGVAGAGEMEMLRGEQKLHKPSSAILLPHSEAGDLTLADRRKNQTGPKKSHAIKLHGKYPKPILSSIIQFTVSAKGVNTLSRAPIIGDLASSEPPSRPLENPPEELT